MPNWDAIRFCKDFKIPFVLPGNSVKVTKGRIGVQCPNPRCGNNHKPDFGSFDLSRGIFSCWGCGGHDIHRVVRWFLKVTNHEAQELIRMYYGTSSMSSMLNNKTVRTGGAKKVILPTGNLKKKHKLYLEGRGFDPDYLIDKYNLTAVGNKCSSQVEREFKNRIIIPIIDHRGKTVSFQGRDVTGTQKIRYKGCPIEKSVMNYKHTLYGLPFAHKTKAVIVEGFIDQWNMGDGFLATAGTATTEQQIKVMAGFDRIFILFDPEKNAQLAANKIANKLAALGKDVEVVDYDGEEDPGELDEADRNYLRRYLGFV